MNRKLQAAVLSVVLFAVQGAASANADSPYRADAEASYNLPAKDTYADQHARNGMSAESDQWGVGRRPAPTAHKPFPFGGGPVDD